MHDQISFVAVKITQTVEIPMEPLFVEGNIYHVSEGVAKILIERGYAEVLPVLKEEIKTSKK